ncbi:helix-turn-helix domain-containing protein [Candidatus Bathyarchaeota archaeon]|nr:helix-turn-helix domain-containing protein [Candidatus Bathyarchaeota archaeon]
MRSYIARELIEKHRLTQVEVAEKLGTTQAAISQYLRLKRGHKGLTQFENMLPVIQEAAREIADKIASENVSSEEIMLKICELCLSMRGKPLKNKR